MTNFRLILVPVIFVIGTTLGRPEDPVETSSTVTDLPSSVTSILSSSVIDNTVVNHIFSSTTEAAKAKNASDNDAGDGIKDEGWEYENQTFVDTRRILYSKTVGIGKRPYMVYLQLTKESAKAHKYRGWLCGGVIVEKYYVLTSAACVEDADKFYIVSGTTKFVDSFDYKTNDCVCKHRRKVVWKCIPKNYKFDFQDSIKWSSNDIAVVKVDRAFKLGVCEKGCEFATDLICYNNISRELEKPGTKAFIAGWGSGSNFREGVYRRQKVHIPENAKCLQEAKVCIMDNEQCAKKWAQRFRSIITQYMICTKDVMKRLSEICEKKYANCTDVETRRIPMQMTDTLDGTKVFNVDLGRHLRDPDDYTARRSSMQGGFCENDHGGPLIVKYQGKERVIGVISACKIDPKSHSCHGPFLYTSVFKNRQFISCAINKDIEGGGDNCRRVFRTGITHEEWTVNWDGYKEDDDDDGKDRIEADDDDDDDDDEKQALRHKDDKKEDKDDKDDKADKADKEDKAEKEEKELKSEKAEDKAEKKESKEESGSKEDKASAKSEHKKEKEVKREAKSDKADKQEKESGEEKKIEKPTKRSKSKKSKKHGKKKAKHSERTGDKDDDEDKKEVFYESSRDENVNDPDE